MNKIFFISKNGLKLCGIWHIPEKKTDRAIILAHGITVDKDETGIFIRLAEKLCTEGFAVFRFDFSGHGESEGSPEGMTITKEIQDMDAAVDFVKKQYPNIGLLGASFGGGIATLFVSENESLIKALCLWNPVLNYDHTFLHPVFPWLKTRIDDVKKDMESKGFTQIGSRKFRVGKNLFDEMERIKPFEALKKIGIPSMILHGDADDHVPYEDSAEYVKNLTQGKLITLPVATHGFQNPNDDPRAIEKTFTFFTSHLL